MFKKKKASKLDLKNALRKNLRQRKLFKKKQIFLYLLELQISFRPFYQANHHDQAKNFQYPLCQPFFLDMK